MSHYFGGDDSDGWMSEGEAPPVYWDHHPTPCSSQESTPEEVPPDGQATPLDLAQASDGEQASAPLEQHPVSWSCEAQTEDNPTDRPETPLDLFQISETELPLVSLDEGPAPPPPSSFETQPVDAPEDRMDTPSDFFHIFEEESPPVSLDEHQTSFLSPEAPAEDTTAEQVTPSDLNPTCEIELPHALDSIPVSCFSFGSETKDIPTDDTAVRPDLLQLFEEQPSPVTSDHNPAVCSTSDTSAEDACQEGPATPSKHPKISEDEIPPTLLDLQPDPCISTKSDEEEVFIDHEEFHAFAAEGDSDLSFVF